MDANKLLADYNYYIRMERRMSPNTVESYCSDVREFFATAGADPLQASGGDVIAYLSRRSGSISKRTQARILSSLRSFFDYTILEGLRNDNPCDRVEAPKMGRRLPDVLSQEEVEAILESVDTRSWQGLRDKAILEVLYGCGLRVSEACSLKVSQVYTDDGFVRVMGKGGKERLVPMGEAAAAAFGGYLAERPVPASPEFTDTAFLNRFGKPLSRVSIFNLIKRQALAAGVDKEISPHSLRHSFATHMIENGADLRVVQEMLGHESILTTEIYTHIDKGTWQRSILEHHPRETKKEAP